MPISAAAEREQLIRDGFCVFEQVLDADTVAGLNEMSEWTLAQVDPSHFAENRARGSIIPYWTYPHPAFAELLVHPGALSVFARLGFDRPRVWSGFVISKPPHSPPLHWHQDGLLWDHPISYTDQPQQYFLMYYLVDTSRDNGCLRLIPGSHRKRHRLHDRDPRATREDNVIRDVALDHPAFQPAEGEIDVPVRAGDVVIGDARLLHSAHGNGSDRRRTVLTIWYWPAYDDLPGAVKALITDHVAESPEWCDWVRKTRSITGPLIPAYDGAAKAPPLRTAPGPALR